MTAYVRRRAIWGLLWRSENRLDGYSEHLINKDCLPALFLTRAAARTYAREHFSYIIKHKDLRAEPHGWKYPIPVRVNVEKKA